jgi:hypothetical protein
VEQLALQLRMSRSRLVALALEDFVRRCDSRALLESLNAAYTDDEPDPLEEARLEGMRRHHRRLVEGEW